MSLHMEQVSFNPAPEGTHPARLVWCIDIGLQDTNFGLRSQVILGFELVNEPLSGVDKNFVLAKFFSKTIAKNSSLRDTIINLTGKEPKAMDLADLLGSACLVTVVHSQRGDDIYPNIQAITAVPKGLTVVLSS